jgi:hypothetical protein
VKQNVCRYILHITTTQQVDKHGGLAERSNASVLKTDLGENLTGVRIPEPPPQKEHFGALFFETNFSL